MKGARSFDVPFIFTNCNDFLIFGFETLDIQHLFRPKITLTEIECEILTI